MPSVPSKKETLLNTHLDREGGEFNCVLSMTSKKKVAETVTDGALVRCLN